MRSPFLCLALVFFACSHSTSADAHPRNGSHTHSGPYSMEVLDESGAPLRSFTHRGRTYVLGAPNQRYVLRVRNGGSRRIEVVASVDGRDVIDGKPGQVDKRGYLVEPWGQVVIDGFRVSTSSVAAFRFSSVSRSYAAQMGSARDVGVIGVAVFSERPAPPPIAYRDDSWSRSYPAPESSGHADRSAGAAAPSSAPSAAEARAESGPRASKRPGLGTAFGEQHASAVTEVPFERASTRPEAIMSLRYNDRHGLIALGIHVDEAWRSRDDLHLRESAQPFRSSGFAQPPPNW